MKCRSCFADVRFITTRNNKKAIVNTQAVKADGEKMLVFADGNVAKVHPNKPQQYTHGYVDHHATCPQSKQWKDRAGKE